jgi:hypothetical protein
MRRAQVDSFRKAELLRLQRANNPKHYRQTKKNYRQTESYIHLTLEERRQFVVEVAQCMAGWEFARLFAECIDKVHFNQLSPTRLSPSKRSNNWFLASKGT